MLRVGERLSDEKYQLLKKEKVCISITTINWICNKKVDKKLGSFSEPNLLIEFLWQQII